MQTLVKTDFEYPEIVLSYFMGLTQTMIKSPFLWYIESLNFRIHLVLKII